jgi:hypothetical protein
LPLPRFPIPEEEKKGGVVTPSFVVNSPLDAIRQFEQDGLGTNPIMERDAGHGSLIA